MESNGMPMQIQVSDATAALLRQSNKGHWLNLRADKVDAKGKGEMQTYWLTPHHSETHRTKSSSSTNMDLLESDADLHEALEAVERKLQSMGRLDQGGGSARSIRSGGGGEAAAVGPEPLPDLQSALAKRVPGARRFSSEQVDV
jgi:Adenylate and Guanylate cyclase catalytic domain